MSKSRGERFDASRLGEYVQRWFRWVRAGLPVGVVSVGLVLVGGFGFYVFNDGGGA